jgi:hypothetical protein
MMMSCCAFGSLSKIVLRHHQRLEHEPVGLVAAGGQVLGDFLELERDEAGRRGHRRVHRAGLHRGVDLVRRQRDHRGAGLLEHHVHLAAAAAHLHALGVLGRTSGVARLATPPACQIQLTMTMPFSSSTLGQQLADLGRLPRRALTRSSAPAPASGRCWSRHFAAGVRQRHRLRSSAPLRSAENCELVFISDEPG